MAVFEDDIGAIARNVSQVRAFLASEAGADFVLSLIHI